MKKILFFATAFAAFVSCSSDELVGGDNSPNEQDTSLEKGIVFGSGVRAVTRADHVGADAAKLLNNKFYVVGFHGDGSNMTQVFDNYIVEWTTNTAGTTQSNTSDWEYVGKTAPAWSGINSNTQTIKYWDYSSTQYDFIAWSPGSAEVTTENPTSGKVKITKPTAGSYSPTYQITGAREDLAKCYIANMVTHYKSQDGQPKFQDEVKLTFRNLASKVRVALYETVPGYSVKDVKFYTDATTPISTGASETDAYLFIAGSGDADKFYTEGTYTVSFPTKGSSNLDNPDYNNAHVAFSATGSDTKENFGALNKVGKELNEAEANNYLGRTLPQASYAGNTSSYYKIVLPNEAGTMLQLRVDYTLLAIDGSGEEIKIHGATAFVPAIYAQWKPNYAYTYIFKISDNTNGWTSTVDTDPAGLYPITFDAIVVDSEEFNQSTITTVASPSITTYQKGHDVTKDEYDAAKGDIYVQVMNDGTLVKDLSSSDPNHPIQVWEVTGVDSPTEAVIADALNIRANYTSKATTGRNGVTLTKVTTVTDFTAIPGVDGNDITITSGDAAKFTPEDNKIYAVTYKGTDHSNTSVYTAVALTSQPDDWATAGVWYTDPDGSTPVSAYNDGTYYKKYTNRNVDWGVKIIKIASTTTP